MQQNVFAMLFNLHFMGEAWLSLANKCHTHGLGSDSDLPPPKSHRSEDLDDIADLCCNSNKSEEEDEN